MRIEESLEQVLNSKQIFGESFYEHFFRDYPEVRPFFEHVNIERQAIQVTMALMVIERQHSQPFLAAESYLKYLGTRHFDRRIPKQLYPRWRANLLNTLKSFHGELWSDELAGQWSDAVDRVTELMFEGYHERFTV